MKQEIKSKPDFAFLSLQLNSGEQVITESGSMVGMTTELTMETNMKGGLKGALKRALGGESLFMNTYTATADNQRLDLAPATPGDVEHLALDGNSVLVQSGSYMSSTPGIEVDSKWAGARGFFGGEGLFMLRCSGQGDLWISSYGAIHAIDVHGTYVVDTGHIVAFDDCLSYELKSIGGLKSLLFSKEGLVCEFSGQGRLWIQTRCSGSLVGFLHPFRSIKPQKHAN
jgi:uncharacterized protein (TIGR00266 family)